MSNVERYWARQIPDDVARRARVVFASDYDTLAAELADKKRELGVCSRGFDAMAKRALAAEAEVARLNMEMVAYREKLTPADAAAMVAVINALYAEKTGSPSRSDNLSTRTALSDHVES